LGRSGTAGIRTFRPKEKEKHMSRAQQFLNPLWGLSATYLDKVLGYSPVAYWPLNEASGTTIVSAIAAAQNGTYTAATVANSTAPDGSPCPLFDGATSWGELQSAALATAFSGAAGTFAIWAKVSAAGVWTDGTADYLFRMGVDANNHFYLRKNSVNNQLGWVYKAGGTQETLTESTVSETAWMFLALTWDKTADQVKAYRYAAGGAGGQKDATATTLGTWVGSPAYAYLASYNATPNQPTSGWLAHPMLFTSALAAASLADLATV
jgi:hypothetical protein